MPQVDLKYSNNLQLDTTLIFKTIEATIAKLDSAAGACKCRGYSTSEYLHSHLFITIALLQKSHRDDTFIKNLLAELEKALVPILPSSCNYAINFNFLNAHYVTSISVPGT